MAHGDDASSKGIHTVPATSDVKVGYDDINQVADAVAHEIDRAQAAEALKFDAAKIVISTTTPADPNVMFWAKPL